MITFDRIKKLCNDKDISIRQLERDAKLPYGTVGNWKDSMPNAEAIMKIATALNTTTDYLLGLTENPIVPGQEDEEILLLQRARNKMSPERRSMMFDILKVVFKQEFANEFSDDMDLNNNKNQGE